MRVEDIRDNLSRVRESAARAALRCGRRPEDVSVLVVTKNQPLEAVLAVHEAGQTVFGENRVQEACMKYVDAPAGLELHLIGHLQTNKAARAAERFDWVQSIDSLRVARELNRHCERFGRVLDVLVEINTCGEESKSGYTDLDLFRADFDAMRALRCLRQRGLMTIGPLGGDELRIRRAFSDLAALLRETSLRHPELRLDVLSMGMSGDYVWAIEEGSTMIRVGTAVFGDRV